MAIKASAESRKKIYQSLCYVLSDRVDRITWSEFAPADWELFSQMADREGVAPLMYWKLKDSVAAVPPSTFNFLRSSYYQTLAQNTLMYWELERILKALNEAGIPVIVLKGAALAVTVYEDIGLRPMGDLDLLVKEEQFQDALKTLLAIGYEEEPRSYQQFNEILGYDVHLWLKSNQSLKVELHWRVISGGDIWFLPGMGWFWEQTESLDLIGKTLVGDLDSALTLSVAALLLYLVGHLMLQHGIEEARLVWFFDIHQLVSYFPRESSWENLTHQAHSIQWISVLRFTLSRIQFLFDTKLPNEIVATLAEEERPSPNDNHLVNSRVYRSRTKFADVWDLFHLVPRENRIRFALGMVFPTPHFMRWRYKPKPTWLWPLCYPYRWMKMVREAVSTFTKCSSSVRSP